MLILRSGGSVVWICSSLARTRSTTSTVLVPDCFLTCRPTAGSPFNLLALRISCTLSWTRPTSPNVIDRAVAIRQDDAVEIVDVLDPAHRAERHFGGAGDEVAAGNLDVLARDRGPHLIDGQPVRVEPIGVQQQLDLAPAIALQLDRPDILHRLEHLLDLLVGDLRDLLLRSRAEDVELEDRRRIGVLLLDLRRPGVARKLLDDRRDLVADVLRRRLDIALEGERDVHLRLALIGVRPQLVDAADGVDRLLDPLGDLGLDLLGAGAGKLDLDVDDRLIGLRHQVEAEILVRERAEHDQRRRHHDGEDRDA